MHFGRQVITDQTHFRSVVASRPQCEKIFILSFGRRLTADRIVVIVKAFLGALGNILLIL